MRWGVSFFETEDGRVPGADFLDSCPTKIDATFAAVLEAVRAAPPPAFSGGGKWEAMHGSMSGFYEIRLTGPGRRHYRLFCILENGSASELKKLGFDRPQIVVINGLVKPNASKFTDAVYRKHVRAPGEEYRSAVPRRVAA